MPRLVLQITLLALVLGLGGFYLATNRPSADVATVRGAPSFHLLVLTSGEAEVFPGETQTRVVYLRGTNGFGGEVSLSVIQTSGAPSVFTTNFAPATVTVADGTWSSSTLTITASPENLDESFPVRVVATGNGVTRHTDETACQPLTVSIDDPTNDAQFTMAASVSSLSVVAGSSVQTTIIATARNGFADPILLGAASSLMDGVATCLGLGTGGIGLPSTITDNWTVADQTAAGESLRIDQGTTSKSLTLSTTADTPPGTYRIALWGFTDCGLIACDDPGFPNITIPGMLSLTVTAPPPPIVPATTTSPSVTPTTALPTVASTTASSTPTTSIPTSTATSTPTTTTSPSATVGNTPSVTPAATVTPTSSPSPAVTPILLPATTTPTSTLATPSSVSPTSTPSPSVTATSQPSLATPTPTPIPAVTPSGDSLEIATGNETLTLSQTEGQPGDQFTVTVGGFTAGSNVTAWWDGYEQTLADGTMEWTGQTALTGGDTDADGNLTLNVGVPTDTFTGPHTVVVGGNPGEVATADFSILESETHPVAAAETALLGPPASTSVDESQPPDATLLAVLALANQAADPSDPPVSTSYLVDQAALGTAVVAQPRVSLGIDGDCRATVAVRDVQLPWSAAAPVRAQSSSACSSSSLQAHAAAARQEALDAITSRNTQTGNAVETLLAYFRSETFVDQFSTQVTGNPEVTIALSGLFGKVQDETPKGNYDVQHAYSLKTLELLNLIDGRLSEIGHRYGEESSEYLEMLAIQAEFQSQALVPKDEPEPSNQELEILLDELDFWTGLESDVFLGDLTASDDTFFDELQSLFGDPVLQSVPFTSDDRFLKAWDRLLGHCNRALRRMVSQEADGRPTILPREVTLACDLFEKYRTQVRSLTGLSVTDIIFKIVLSTKLSVLSIESDGSGNLTLRLYDPAYSELPIQAPLQGNREFIDAFRDIVARVTERQRTHVVYGPESITQTFNSAFARRAADTFGIQVGADADAKIIDHDLRNYLWSRWLPAQFADQPVISRSEPAPNAARVLAANPDELALDYKTPASYPPRWTYPCRISKPKTLETVSLHAVHDDSHDQRHHLKHSTSEQTSVLEQMIEVDGRQPSFYVWFEGVGKLPSDGLFFCTYTLPKQGENYELKDTHFLAGALAGLNEHRYRTVRWSYGWWGRDVVVPAVAVPQGWTDEVATEFIPKFLQVAGYSGDVTDYHKAAVAQADPLVERFFARVQQDQSMAWEDVKRDVSSENRLSFRCEDVCFVTPVSTTPGISGRLKEYWESLPETMAALVESTAMDSLPFATIPTTPSVTVSDNANTALNTAVAAEPVSRDSIIFAPTNYIRVSVDGSSRGALLIDPRGRVAGFNPVNGASVSTIDGSTYSGPGERSRLFLPGLSHGTYQLILFGLAAGEHTAKVTIAAGEEVIERTFTAHLEEGGQTTETFEIDLSEQEEVTPGLERPANVAGWQIGLLLSILVALGFLFLIVRVVKKRRRQPRRRSRK